MKVIIKKMGINGEGIAYHNQKPIFVKNVLVDEEVDAKVTPVTDRYSFGEVMKIYRKSKDRIASKCRVQHICGGCPLMIARYPYQVRNKEALLKQALIKYAHIDSSDVAKMIQAETIFTYRNQLKFPFGKDRTNQLINGMYMPESNVLIDIKKCFIHEEGLERIRMEVVAILKKYHMHAYQHHRKQGLRSLMIRGFNQRYQCCIVSGNDTFSTTMIQELANIKGMHSVWQCIQTSKQSTEISTKQMQHLALEPYLPLTINHLQLHISPLSFFQLHTQQATKLYETIASFVQGKKKLIVEAYSGIGAISLYLKDSAEQIIGIECVKDAVINANQNAAANHCEHIHFICDDAANKLEYLSKKSTIDLLILDPPRAGLQDEMIECILKSKIKEIIYVSCNPATLAKNLARLLTRYRINIIQPIDMFPHTQHVECIVKLCRMKK